MQITVNIKGLEQITSRLSGTVRQAEIATQRALLNTAKAVMSESQKEMRKVFDRPTRFTLNALVTTLDKPNMRATVEVKDGYWHRADNYLSAQISGGQRKLKAFERNLQHYGVMPVGWLAVPGECASLDSFGNMSVGQIRQILSWFDAAERVAGSTQNMGQKGRDKKRKGTRNTRGFEYFVAQPGSRSGLRSWMNGRNQNLTPGIYKRTSFVFGTSIQPIVIFVRSATYKPRFKFYENAQRIVNERFDAEFHAAVSRELSR